jgi:hypothetical protein
MLLLRLGLNSILGLFCQASFENEPKTRKAQIQGEIRAKKGPKFGFENEPERTHFSLPFGGGKAQNQQTNPNEPEKTKPTSLLDSAGLWDVPSKLLTRAATALYRLFTVFSGVRSQPSYLCFRHLLALGC